MSTRDIREYIANQIRSLDNIGVVHSKNKLPKTSGDFKTLFEYDGRVQGWTVTRTGLGNRASNTNFLKVPESYMVSTFLGFNDTNDSESLFDDAVDRVYELLAGDSNKTFGGLVANVISVSVPDCALIKVGEIYSHYADIVIDLERFK